MTYSSVILDQKHRSRTAALLLSVLGASLVVYCLTCFRTVTWWDSTNYTIAAFCLGVPAPPGSLIAVIVGWLVTRIVPTPYSALALNVCAALLGALTAALAGLVGWRLAGIKQSEGLQGRAEAFVIIAAAIVGGLTAAFSATLWLHSTKFTPYIFTACLTLVIVWQLVRWWEDADKPRAWTRLLLVALLLGLDFSIHRTNLLLLPGVVLWVGLRQARLLASWKLWVGAIGALGVGLLFHLLLIPIAAAKPFMNFNDPSTLGRFWDYVSLKQFGGNWLVNVYPRKAPFWSYQVTDYFRTFGDNFFVRGGTVSVLGVLPTLFGLIGFATLLKRQWRLAGGLLVLFLAASFGAIIYFNIPAGFFRPFDRHYLPSFMIFAVLVVYGVIVASQVMRRITVTAWPRVALVGLMLLLMPGVQLLRNYRALDGSNNYIAYDFGRNYLATLPPNAIILTYGDTDTYGLWYLQHVEGSRPDVTVINTWLLNTPWYVHQLVAQDSLLPLTLTSADIDTIAPRAWPDSTVAVPVDASPRDTALFHIPPSVQGKYVIGHEWLVAQMIAENRFRRPVYFSSGGGPNIPPWIAEHLRFEGLAMRLQPETNPATDLEIVGQNILVRYSYRGFADSSVCIDEASMSLASVYWSVICRFLAEAKGQQSADIYAAERNRIVALMPPQRFAFVSGDAAKMVSAVASGQF